MLETQDPTKEDVIQLCCTLREKADWLSRFAEEREEVQGTIGKKIMEARAKELEQVALALDDILRSEEG